MNNPLKNIALPKGLSRTVGKLGLTTKKYSPEILTAVGIAGVVGTVILASRATLKAVPVVEQVVEDIEVTKSNIESQEDIKPANKDMALIYAKGSLDIIKIYAPAVTLGLTSIGCILAAHGIMRRRNVALAAAYQTVERGFAEYRKRVEDEIGKERSDELRLGIEKEEVVDEETGETYEGIRVDRHRMSPYARIFEKASSSEWQREDGYNLMFLRAQQAYFTQRLQARGYVLLNEVYHALGFQETSAGAVVGWSLGAGDDYVDFGIYEPGSEQKRLFINGEENSVLLDFNVAGKIFDHIDNFNQI